MNFMEGRNMEKSSDFNKSLKEFSRKLIPQYSHETVKRTLRRIKTLANRGMDPFNIDIEWVYQYCDDALNISRKRKKSLRIEMDDLDKWIKFTGQQIVVPKFLREPDQEAWIPSDQELNDVLQACSKKFNEKIRDRGKQEGHERKWFRTYTIILVLADGGMRNSELVAMNLDDIREKGVFIRSAKREKNRFVALSPSTLENLQKYKDEYRENTDQRALWTGNTGRLSTAMVRKYIKDAGNAAGVPRMHPHGLRHYCATNLLKMGVDIRTIQIHMGHSNISSTEIYTHRTSSDVQIEIYKVYSSVRGHDFFLNDEEAVIC